MDFKPLRPFKAKVCNMVLTAPPDDPNVRDMHAMRFTNEAGLPAIVSFWKIDSITDRVKFLETGVLALYTLGLSHPPVSILVAPNHDDFKEVTL